MFQVIGYICHELDIIVTLFHYIWRFPECRMNFYQMFSRVNQRFRTKAQTLRIEVFNIVTFESKDNEYSVYA